MALWIQQVSRGVRVSSRLEPFAILSSSLLASYHDLLPQSVCNNVDVARSVAGASGGSHYTPRGSYVCILTMLVEYLTHFNSCRLEF